jgi:NUMOD3 motif
MSNQTRSKTVYALCDPREPSPLIRYIGCTSQKVSNRVQSHVHEAITTDAESRKAVWLRELIRDNHEPVYMVLEVVTGGFDWQAREQYWIAKTPNLLNDTGGGIGARGLSLETRALISRKLTGHKQSQETIDKRAHTIASFGGVKHTAEAKAKISAAHKGKVYGALPQATKDKLKQTISQLVWINDGTTNKRVKPSLVPMGWSFGRVKLTAP